MYSLWRAGDTEMTMELATYMQTAVCKEQTEVLVLEKKHYERLFVRRHPRTIDAMRQQIAVRLMARKSLLSSKDDIPFLGYLAKIIEVKSRPPQAPERERVEPTVSEAEKEFLNHKGPLIDLHGPGSVFYLIKVLSFGVGKVSSVLYVVGCSSRYVSFGWVVYSVLYVMGCSSRYVPLGWVKCILCCT